MNPRTILAASLVTTACLCFGLAGVAAAAEAHGSDMVVGSDADGGGNLLIEYPFDEVPVIAVSASGFPGLFTSTDPGFVPAEDEPLEGIYQLEIPTTVGFEIVSIDENVQVQLGMSTLSGPGDSAVIGTHDDADPELSSLHTHPQFLLTLAAPSAGEFAEGRFSFRLYDDGATYGESQVYALEVSNGYLPVLETPTTAHLACRRTVAKAVGKLAGETSKRVTACFHAALVQTGLGEAAAAIKPCNLNPGTTGSLAARLESAHAKALGLVAKNCGALTDLSEPFTLSAVSAHLGMASCRAQEVAGAAFGQARFALEEVLGEAGGDGTCNAGTCSGGALAGTSGCSTDEECSVEYAIDSALPCLKTAAGHEED
ncbi:MAG: hypothetical protein ABR538_13615 [Candidatus Binatia bacterium]